MSERRPADAPESEGSNPFPPPPPTLDYSRPQWHTGYQPRTPVWVQFIIGMIAPYLATIGFGAMAGQVTRNSGDATAGAVLGLVAVFVIGAVVRVKYAWRGFLPGVFVGLGVGLVSGVICFFVVCGNMRF